MKRSCAGVLKAPSAALGEVASPRIYRVGFLDILLPARSPGCRFPYDSPALLLTVSIARVGHTVGEHPVAGPLAAGASNSPPDRVEGILLWAT
jgi:hypothetical protein